MLTGLEPVESSERMTRDRLTRPCQIQPAIYCETGRLVLRAMQVMSKKRYSTMQIFKDELQPLTP